MIKSLDNLKSRNKSLLKSIKNDEDNGDTKSIFATSSAETPTIAEVMVIVDDAERSFPGSESARSLYCRSKGVDYENVTKYMHHVASLSLMMEEKCEESPDDGAVRIKIMGTPIMIVTPHGKCPLCGDMGHRLSMCPMLPPDVRPFIR